MAIISRIIPKFCVFIASVIVLNAKSCIGLYAFDEAYCASSWVMTLTLWSLSLRAPVEVSLAIRDARGSETRSEEATSVAPSQAC